MDGTGRREHEDAGERLPGHQFPADVVAVDLGEVAVEHHHVVAVDGGLGQGRPPVQDNVHGHALAAQSARDGVGQPLFVFDQEDPHLLSDVLALGPRWGDDTPCRLSSV